MINSIIARRDNNGIRKNTQGNRSIFNQIRHIYETCNKLISIAKKTPTPYHIGDIVNIPLLYDRYD